MNNSENIVQLTEYKPSHNNSFSDNMGTETTPLYSQDQQPTKILAAAKDGDVRELEKLLLEKKESVRKNFVYPRDWKYTFDHLIRPDKDGRTALHLAASIGDPSTALQCVKLILQSIQVLHSESPSKKTRELLEQEDNNKETPLHLAIENRATTVVSFLLEHNANTKAKNRNGEEALVLIYKHLPDAMKAAFDGCIQFNPDHKSFCVNWGPVIGLRFKPPDEPINHNPTILLSIDSDTSVTKVVPSNLTLYEKETQCIKHILNADKWGAALLLHPLVKYYLHLKWKKVQWFFWISFALQMLWLLLYGIIYVDLHLNITALEEVNCTDGVKQTPALNASTDTVLHCGKSALDLDYASQLWHLMLFLSLLVSGKEVFQAWILRKAYFTAENLSQILFITLFIFQYSLLVCKIAVQADVIASISAVTIIVSTILVIFQLGKTPMFGLQVAAFKKVIQSCIPHLPIFFVWFVGFGLAFWAVFYNAEKSWIVGMLAIVAAMGTGELNAQDHLEKVASGPFSLQEFIRVFCIILFVIIIVTLYFNLLIGYAVSDIQILKTKAETLQLYNKLSTMHTIESFLVSRYGRFLVAIYSKINCRQRKSHAEVNYMDDIYVLPLSQFHRNDGMETYTFDKFPPQQLKLFKKIAFNNILKRKKEKALLRNRINKFLK